MSELRAYVDDTHTRPATNADVWEWVQANGRSLPWCIAHDMTVRHVGRSQACDVRHAVLIIEERRGFRTDQT